MTINMKTLDLSSLKKAIVQLQRALHYCASDSAKNDSELAEIYRSAAIQAFEFTFELSYKFVKRYLELTELNPSEIDTMSFNETIRKGFEVGIIKADLRQWQEFRKNRGITSHTYNPDKAQEVFEAIPAFLTEAEFILDILGHRIHKI